MEQRMYSIVLRHLSGIQKGIQHGHSKDAYEIRYSDTLEYQQWLNIDKTVVILETHSTDLIADLKEDLVVNNILYSEFREPDLGNIITAISFMADASVWDFDNYPNMPFDPIMPPLSSFSEMKEIKSLRQYEANVVEYGSQIAFLKLFHRKFNLASN